MTAVNQNYPQFEKNSPSGYYQQISNFCVNYLEGLLVNLMHMDIPEALIDKQSEFQELQNKLLLRERTVRHAFQFQIEKNFADFKSIRRTRLHANRANDLRSLGVAGQKSSQILDIIEHISDKNNKIHGTRILNQGIRLKSLVHRTDKLEDDNPLTPGNLSQAFLASVETLSLTLIKTSQLFKLFEYILDEQLNSFYVQVDLGMYYLDIFPELTDPALFAEPDSDTQTQIPEPEPEIIFDDGTLDLPPIIPETTSEAIKTPDKPELKSEPKKPSKKTQTADNNAVAKKTKVLSKDTAKQTDKTKLKKKNQFPIILQKFRQLTLNGTLDYQNIYNSFLHNIKNEISEQQFMDFNSFFHFFSRLLGNALLSDPLKKQLSRLSYALVKIVEIEPSFFRSSDHPINDLIQSVVDFEIRSRHQEHSLVYITQLIDQLCQIDSPTSADFMPIIESYEKYKDQNLEIISLEKWQQQQADKQLEKELLQIMNQMTQDLVVDTETLAFFYDDWQLLLFQIAKKLGKNSREYKQSFEIADVLAWTLSENRDDELEEYARYSFTELLRAIDKGLKTLDYSSDHRIRVRKQLLKEFKQISEKPEITISGSRKHSGIAQKKKITSVFDKQPSQLLDMTAYSSPRTAKRKTKVEFKPDIGTWVVIKEKSSSAFKPARLNWKAEDSSVYLFIDQRGHVLKECDQQTLNEEFAAGNIKLLKKKVSAKSTSTQLGSGFSYFE